jgi:6-phosphogluconolactonase
MGASGSTKTGGRGRQKLDNRVEVLVFDSDDALDEFAVIQWRGICSIAIQRQGYAAIALSGGKTPIHLYARLAEERMTFQWDKVHIFLVDERFLPSTDRESNGHMIRETLLARIDIPGNNFHPISTANPSSDSAAREYERNLKEFFNLPPGRFPEFDLIMLGIGEDGHTASLFPGSSALQETNRLVVSATGPLLPRQRITLTLPVINHARNILVVAKGAQKAEVLERVIQDHDQSLPASMVTTSTGKMLFLVDKEAGVHVRGPR